MYRVVCVRILKVFFVDSVVTNLPGTKNAEGCIGFYFFFRNMSNIFKIVYI